MCSKTDWKHHVSGFEYTYVQGMQAQELLSIRAADLHSVDNGDASSDGVYLGRACFGALPPYVGIQPRLPVLPGTFSPVPCSRFHGAGGCSRSVRGGRSGASRSDP